MCACYVTFDMAGGGCDPQSVEELIRLLVDHEEADFLPSCSNEGHHLRVPQALYVHSIHLRQRKRRRQRKQKQWSKEKMKERKKCRDNKWES